MTDPPTKAERVAAAKAELSAARQHLQEVWRRYDEASQALTDAQIDVLMAEKRVRQIEAER